MMGGGADLLQALPRVFGNIRVIESNAVQTYDGIHGSPDFMAHIRQEGGLCPVG